MNEPAQNFDDYLSEFEKLIPFDSEICPVCGIKISDTVSVSKSPFVDLITVTEEENVNSICKILEKHEIEFKVLKELENTFIEGIKYKYRIAVLMCNLEAAKSLIIKIPIQNEPGF